jgi:phosphoribosylglycinamide formyltransferase-1
MSKRILLLASGTGSLARAILVAHQKGAISAEFVGVISDRDSPALEVALEFKIPALYLPMLPDRQEWDRQIFEMARNVKPDLIVSVGFMRILAADFVNHFRVINTHPSLLPLYPGAHAVRDALAAGAQRTGTTVHWVDTGLDTGPVISQRSVVVEPGDDESTLHERIKIAERALIVETLAEYGRTGTL